MPVLLLDASQTVKQALHLIGRGHTRFAIFGCGEGGWEHRIATKLSCHELVKAVVNRHGRNHVPPVVDPISRASATMASSSMPGASNAMWNSDLDPPILPDMR